MIKLTRIELYAGDNDDQIALRGPVWVNPAKIVWIRPADWKGKPYTLINCDRCRLDVKETPEEIMAMPEMQYAMYPAVVVESGKLVQTG